MAESEERYGMSKLEGASNLRTWRIQIKALLMERRLWASVALHKNHHVNVHSDGSVMPG